MRRSLRAVQRIRLHPEVERQSLRRCTSLHLECLLGVNGVMGHDILILGMRLDCEQHLCKTDTQPDLTKEHNYKSAADLSMAQGVR